MNETQRLKKHTEEFQEDLRKDRERKKPKPNENMDKDIPDKLESFDFWCDTCQQDFKSSARKTRYRLEGDMIATLRGQCPDCGETTIRYATHRDQDPYYQKSLKIRKQRNQYRIEMLQSQEYGFKTHYGDPDREFNEMINRQEERIMAVDWDSGLRGQSLKAKNKLEELHRLKDWRRK
jgi:ribosomal protein S27AE